MDLDVERKKDMMTLSVELKTWLWTPNRKHDSEHKIEDAALNSKLKMWLYTLNWRYDSKRQTENMTLNAKPKEDVMDLDIKLKTNDDSECQIEDATLNVELKTWL